MQEIHDSFESIHRGERATVFYRCWLPDGSVAPRGAVILAHGMAEHSGRYRAFAEVLTTERYAVYAPDHRGHGASVLPGEPRGLFAPADGWNAVVNDIKTLADRAREGHPGVPLFLIGHSMGSFIARSFAIRFGEMLDGLALLGTAGPPRWWERILVPLIVRLYFLFRGPRGLCQWFHLTSLRRYNAPFRQPGETSDYLWLSRDPAVARAFDADPLCGGVFPAVFFRDLAEGILFMSSPSNISRMPKDLPVLIASGDNDPVGRFGTGVREVHDLFVASGMRSVTLKLYPGARHELHHETNREEFFTDLLAWLGTIQPKSTSSMNRPSL